MSTWSNGTINRIDGELMHLKGELSKQEVSFAMLTYPFDEAFKNDRDFCMQSSSEHLRKMIDLCRGRIALRDLTEQERDQMQELKEEQKSGWTLSV